MPALKGIGGADIECADRTDRADRADRTDRTDRADRTGCTDRGAATRVGVLGLGGLALPAHAAGANAQPDAGHAWAHAVVQLQSAFDPFAPWVLMALVLLAAALARRAHRQALATAAHHWPFGVWLALAGVLGAAAVAISWGVASGNDTLLAWDRRGAEWGAAMRAAGWRTAAAQIGDVADVLPMSCLTVLIGALLWVRGRGALALGWLLATAINSLWGRVLKGAIARARPGSAAHTLVSGLSFPSGHTVGAVMVWGLLAWLLCRRLPPLGQWLGALGAALLVGIVGASRVVLGVHYLSDVVGGLLWAAALLVCAIVALRSVADRFAPSHRARSRRNEPLTLQ